MLNKKLKEQVERLTERLDFLEGKIDRQNDSNLAFRGRVREKLAALATVLGYSFIKNTSKAKYEVVKTSMEG